MSNLALNNNNNEPLSVSALNDLAKNYLENHFSNIYVVGEISKITVHNSGHLYFTIKDNDASISCVMFNGAKLKLIPKVGFQVVLVGKLTLYKASGTYQFLCSALHIKSSLGLLQAQFEELFQKLKNEGLFLDIHKKPLPKFISKIALITANSGAAIRDMLRVYESNEAYLSKIVIYDSLMQGENAPKDIVNAINRANNDGVSVIVLARGGGSKEDLFCFNDERIVRAIVASKVPVVTGIGHEIDIHLSDYAASYSAQTPTAAMAYVCYNKLERLQAFDELESKFNKIVKNKLALLERNLLFYNSKFSKKEVSKNYDYFKKSLDDKAKLLNVKIKTQLEQKALIFKYLNLEQKLQEKLINKQNELKLLENKLNLDNLKNVINLQNDLLNNKALIFNANKINSILKKELNNLEQQKLELSYRFTKAMKNRFNKLDEYERLLNTKKAFLESISEYARMFKDEKAVKLEDLHLGDEFKLVSNNITKVAKIIGE